MSTLLESRLDPQRKADCAKWDEPPRVLHPAAQFLDSADRHLLAARRAFSEGRIGAARELIEFAQEQLARAHRLLPS
jgi:hypothetical protein